VRYAVAVRIPFLAIACIALLGCSDHTDLFVELRTDFSPAVEFVSVETVLEQGGRERTISSDVAVTRDALAGIRIADFDSVNSSGILRGCFIGNQMNAGLELYPGGELLT
jgi:hypothetical protein